MTIKELTFYKISLPTFAVRHIYVSVRMYEKKKIVEENKATREGITKEWRNTPCVMTATTVTRGI